jgi:L-aspartate oxidase
MAETGSDHVWLDARHLGADFLRRRFPTIHERLADHCIDMTTELVPVAPAQHYHSGGVVTDIVGRTTVPGLYAAGEVACTGVHGANRLASNSLTEGVVAGTRVGRDLAWELPEVVEPTRTDDGGAGLLSEEMRTAVRSTMSRHVGVSRRPEGLAAAQQALAEISENIGAGVAPTRRAFESTNLLTVAAAVVAAAGRRTESRGCHRRTDFTEPRPEWKLHLTERLDESGSPFVAGAPEGL